MAEPRAEHSHAPRSLGRDNDDSMMESDVSSSSPQDDQSDAQHQIPRLLRRTTTRRRSVYSAQHVILAIHLGRTTYKCLWILLLLLRVWCILFLVWTAQLYWFVAHPYMGYYASLIGPSAVANFKPMGVGFAGVALLQAFQLYKMIYWSLHYDHLVLGPPPRSLGPMGDAHCFLNELVESSSQTTQVYQSSTLVAKVWLNNLLVTVTVLNCWSTPLVRFFFRKADPRSAQSAALERFLVLAVDFVLDATTSMVIPMLLFAPYYEKFDFEVFNFEQEFLYDDIWFANMVMENQQLLAQTKWDFLSKMVPHLSIYGSLNSMRALVKPPQRLASSSAAARVYCESSSSATALVAPTTTKTTATATATSLATTEEGDSTPVELLKTPTDPQLLELSPRDDTVVAAAITSKVKPKPKPPSRITSNSFPPIREGKLLTHPSMGVIQRNLSFLLSPSSSSSSPASASASLPLPPHGQRPRQRQIQNAIQFLLFLWGLALLVLHMRAAWRAQSVSLAACTTRTRPWFATNVSCAVVRFNCFAHNVTTPTNALLEMIEPSSVGALVFSHCAQLHMPSILSQFRNLLGVDMYNCTLHSWGLDAAITEQRHPRLTYVIFVYTNMTRLPDGVLQTLPATMTDFEIAVSNLTHLPDDLHERWHPMSLLYVEHAQLTQFPPTLLHLHVDDLSLIGNQIELLPEFDSTTSFYTLAMTHTPLRELPASIGDLTSIGFLNLGFTQLTVLPPWMDQVATTATKICIHNTPFCKRQSDETIFRHYGADAVVSCMEESDENVDGKYPLAILRPKRPLLPELPSSSTNDPDPLDDI